MKELKEKILTEGEAIGTEIVKVDGFLNHQLDIGLMKNMGREFKRIFADKNPDKILTVEASGIAVSLFVASEFSDIPVVFAKKALPSTMVDGFFSAECKSFTKGTTSILMVSKKFLKEGERVIIIDDFLAHGEAGLALIKIAKEAGCIVKAFGSVIEKGFQGGRKKLEEEGVYVESLVVIEKIENGEITFSK